MANRFFAVLGRSGVIGRSQWVVAAEGRSSFKKTGKNDKGGQTSGDKKAESARSKVFLVKAQERNNRWLYVKPARNEKQQEHDRQTWENYNERMWGVEYERQMDL